MKDKNKLIITIFVLILIGVSVGSIYLKKIGKSKIAITPTADLPNVEKVVTQPEDTSNSLEKQSLLNIVSSHDNKDDCWIIVGSNVYNITSLFSKNGGGDKILEMSCGKDATELFDARNNDPSTAKIKLEELLVN